MRVLGLWVRSETDVGRVGSQSPSYPEGFRVGLRSGLCRTLKLDHQGLYGCVQV